MTFYLVSLTLAHRKSLGHTDSCGEQVPRDSRDVTRTVHALPLDRECEVHLRCRVYPVDGGSFIPVLGKGFEVDLDTNDEVIEAVWGWVFGSRMMTSFGSSQAKELAERSPLIKGVLLWREKLATFKQTRDEDS